MKVTRFKKVCVLGLGYIGLPTASMFATHGIDVVGVDVNPHVVETLNRGEIHIEEVGLAELVQVASYSFLVLQRGKGKGKREKSRNVVGIFPLTFTLSPFPKF